MFSRKKNVNTSPQDKYTTLVGKNTSFQGELNVEGTLRVDGKIEGELIIKGDSYIGEDGEILGNIKSTNIIVAGVVKGNIIASDQLRITATGKILGDVTVKTFVVDENAHFQGKCNMTKAVENKQVSELDPGKIMAK